VSHSLTIKDALSHAASLLVESDSAVLDSEVLLAHALQKDRSYFRAWPEKTLTAEELRIFNLLIEKRIAGTPVSYITEEREFWSRAFKTSPDVLIPRPDTELLIEIILHKFNAKRELTILDLGTGSGAIAITLALELNNAHVTAVDFSQEALSIARHNASHHKVGNIQFIHSDWFNNIPNEAFSLIVSNPPYIDCNDPHLLEGDVRFEPHSALVAGHNGFSDIEHITKNAMTFLKPNGILLFEHGYQQGKQVQILLESSGFKSIEQFQDLQGHTRATLGINRNKDS